VSLNTEKERKKQRNKGGRKEKIVESGKQIIYGRCEGD
jgi:hypothetical protein